MNLEVWNKEANQIWKSIFWANPPRKQTPENEEPSELSRGEGW